MPNRYSSKVNLEQKGSAAAIDTCNGIMGHSGIQTPKAALTWELTKTQSHTHRHAYTQKRNRYLI